MIEDNRICLGMQGITDQKKGTTHLKPSMKKDLILSTAVGVVVAGGLSLLVWSADGLESKWQLSGCAVALGLFMGLLTYLESPSAKGETPKEDTRSAVIVLMVLLLIAQLGIIDYFVIAKIPRTTEGYPTIVTTWITATTVQTIVVLGAIAFKYLFSDNAARLNGVGGTGEDHQGS